MNAIYKSQYLLLLSKHPKDVFEYFEVNEMHGLNLKDCLKHENSNTSAYIAGWCNYIPKISGEYKWNDPKFVYINLNRCNNELETITLIMHEMFHMALHLYRHNAKWYEEEIITWAELETKEVYNYIMSIKK